MKSKQRLMTALVGIAMMAMPITALAGDHGRDFNGRAALESRGSGRMIVSAPAPRASGFGGGVATRVRPVPAPVTTRYMGPPVVGGQVVPRSTRYMGPPVAVGTFVPVGHHYGWNHERDYDHDGDRGYDNDGDRGYYAAPSYSAVTPYYGTQGYGYAGGNCARAQRIMRVYNRDRMKGHPAAAADLLRQNQWALNSGCVGASPSGSGLFNGLLGGSAYQNNGGYNSGYNNYNNGGYNQGYGYNQPYGNGASSMLAPLLQQFVH